MSPFYSISDILRQFLWLKRVLLTYQLVRIAPGKLGKRLFSSSKTYLLKLYICFRYKHQHYLYILINNNYNVQQPIANHHLTAASRVETCRSFDQSARLINIKIIWKAGVCLAIPKMSRDWHISTLTITVLFIWPWKSQSRYVSMTPNLRPSSKDKFGFIGL